MGTILTFNCAPATSANGAIAYADHCIGLMKEKADISLYNAFQVLLDERYVTARKDDAFEEAVESATLAVQTMQRSAKEKSEDAKAMVELLQKVNSRPDECLSNSSAQSAANDSHPSSTRRQTVTQGAWGKSRKIFSLDPRTL